VIPLILSLWAAQTVGVAPPTLCREWHDCRRLALEAYAQHDYERFHDLAWRAVQTGPPRDKDLMFMLARAQSLSGRPHDALVMLERLAEMGFAAPVVADDDFRGVRLLRQWPELEAMLTGAPAVVPSPPEAPLAHAAAPDRHTAPPAPSAAGAPSVSRRGEEALRIPGTIDGSAGLAYDRISSRFVVTDTDRRKLMIIDERSHHVVDLVTAASAGFYDITGFEIDSARGDLWVVTAQDQTSALHKLQLVSGRPLDRIAVPDDLVPCRFADVAVTPDGRVLVLDTAGLRLLRYRSAARTFAKVAALPLESPTSLAAAGDRIAYVAHAAGIARIDTITGAVDELEGPRDAPLTGFERIRWARESLVGVQRLPDGTRRAARIRIAGGRATGVEAIDADLSPADHPLVTVSADEFFFLVHEPAGETGDIVIRRGRLR
jgi:hypothetical protein